MNKIQISKIENFFKQEMTPELKDVTVVSQNGEYELFGKYRISMNRQGYYTAIHKQFSEYFGKFSFLKNAVAWCIFHNLNKRYEADTIIKLDRNLSSIEVSIEVHKKLSNNFQLDNEMRWTQLVKLQEDIRKKKELTKQLKSLINSSKRIQLERFKTRKNNQISYR